MRVVDRAAPQLAPSSCGSALFKALCTMACVHFVVHSVLNSAPFGIALLLEANKVLYEVVVNILTLLRSFNSVST